jgi:hypothetical protein
MTDTVTAALDAIRARSDHLVPNVGSLPIAHAGIFGLLETAGDVPRLLKAVEYALAEHPVRHDAGGAPVCAECSAQKGVRVNPDRCLIRLAIAQGLAEDPR